MSKLPIFDEIYSPFGLFIERMKLCKKVLTHKKVIVTTICMKNFKTYNTDTLSITRDELAISSRLTIMNLSKDEDLKQNLLDKLAEFDVKAAR